MASTKERESDATYGGKDGDDFQILLSNSDEESGIVLRGQRPSRPLRPILFQVTCCTFALVLGIWLGRQHPLDVNRDIMPMITQYSPPVLEDIDMKFHSVRFNGTFLHENIFRQDASPEVDSAWKSLGADYRSVVVPEHLAEKAGLAHDQVKIRSKYGGGYPANVEGLHHLHCLNLLRKTLYYNYDYYHALGEGAFINSDHVLRKHTTHCLDILRQQLMCTVDVGVLGQIWWDSNAHTNVDADTGPHEQPSTSTADSKPKLQAFTDFNTVHKCRDFEAVRQWAQERQLPEVVPEDFLEPPGMGDRVYDAIP